MGSRDISKGSDLVRVGLGISQPPDMQKSMGKFRVWTTRNGIPVRGLVRQDGSRVYECEAFNACTTEMLNLLRNIMSRLGVNASGPAGGLWTAGPYIGLALNASPIVASDTLSSIAAKEASGNGYTGRIVPTWAAGATGIWNNTASAASWTASGGNLGGGALGQLFTTPAASGTGTAPNVILMTFATLNGGPYTIASGNSINVTYQMTHS